MLFIGGKKLPGMVASWLTFANHARRRASLTLLYSPQVQPFHKACLTHTTNTSKWPKNKVCLTLQLYFSSSSNQRHERSPNVGPGLVALDGAFRQLEIFDQFLELVATLRIRLTTLRNPGDGLKTKKERERT